MTVTAHRRARAGELIAYALPPGDIWLEILAAHASSGASFLPIDVRLSDRERRAVIERARPGLLVTPDDEVLFADPAPVDPDRAWAVVATSGVSGRPKLAELPRTALGAAVAGSLTALDASVFDPWVACLSPAHVGGLMVLLRGALAGAPVDVFDGSELARLAVEPPDGAHIALVPTLLRRLVATAGAFTVDGWLRTGDMGELDAEGRLVVHGRSDDTIRSGAETVWPDEVEAALRSHPGVADVAVTGVADHEWGQRVVAWVVPADRALPPTLDALREHCRERLARFKAPRELILVDALPRTPSGKLQRAAVPPGPAEPHP